MQGAFLRRHVVSIGIVALAVLFGVYVYFVDRGRPTTNETEARKRNVFQVFRRGDISEIVIEKKDETIRVLSKKDDAGDAMYYLTEGEVADQAAVDKLLGALEFATAERRLGQAVDRKAMELESPRIRVTLAMGHVTFRLSVGAAAPSPPGAAYAELEGAGGMVVARDLVTELSKGRDTYRGKTLVPYLSSSLSELKLEGVPDTRVFSRSTEGGWKVVLDRDQKVRVDRDVFDRLLSSLAELRAEAFTSEAEAVRAQSEAKDLVRVTMRPSDAAAPRAIIDVGGPCPGHPEYVVAIRSEPPPKKVACAPKVAFEGLSMPLSRFPDRHLFSLRPDEMEQITLASGNDKLEIVRAGTGWRMRAPSEANVDNEVGQGFARTLQDLAAEEVAVDGVLGPVRATATITKAGGSDDSGAGETVEIGSDQADGPVYVKRLSDGVLLKVARDAALALLPNSFTLRSRKVIEEAPSHVRRVTIDSPAVHQELRRSGAGEWTLEEPKSLAIDPSLAIDVAEALAQLRADRWVAERDDGSFGFDSPRAKYELEVEEAVIRVEIGRSTSGGAFARRQDRDGIFVLSQAAERKLETWAVDRSYFMLEPDEIRRIRIDRGADHVVLERGDDGGSPSEGFESGRRLLSEMRTEGVVHLGGPARDEGFDKPLVKLSITRTRGPQVQIRVGRGDAWRETSVFYIRRDGIDATFAIAQSKIRPLFEIRRRGGTPAPSNIE